MAHDVSTKSGAWPVTPREHVIGLLLVALVTAACIALWSVHLGDSTEPERPTETPPAVNRTDSRLERRQGSPALPAAAPQSVRPKQGNTPLTADAGAARKPRGNIHPQGKHQGETHEIRAARPRQGPPTAMRFNELRFDFARPPEAALAPSSASVGASVPPPPLQLSAPKRSVVNPPTPRAAARSPAVFKLTELDPLTSEPAQFVPLDVDSPLLREVQRRLGLVKQDPAELIVDGRRARFDVLQARTGDATARGFVSRTAQGPAGTLLLSTPYANFDFKVAANDLQVQLLLGKDWFTWDKPPAAPKASEKSKSGSPESPP